MKKDPVCQMDVNDDTKIRSTYKGEEYLFCAQGCKEAFEKSPTDYLSCCSSSEPLPEQEKRGLSAYTPLFVIILLSALAAFAKQVAYAAGWQGSVWMHDFMGVFLVVFAMVKLFNLKAFADGFQKYDLLAGISRPYAYTYPFLELALGLGFLSMWQPTTIYIATIVLLLFGSLGVFNSMRKGENLNCACMGQILNVPVSTVTLTEDLGMAAMAAVMLFFG